MLRPGEVTGPPDFVGIGAQKAGTTWWYQLILSHPDVTSRPELHKERHFLDRFGAVPFGTEDIDRYHGWFPHAAGTLTGEWTPDYMTFSWAPELLKRAAPKARLLVLLRDPVERFRSGLGHQRRMGTPDGADMTTDAVQRGFYHRALSGWLECFDRDQLLILQYERCTADPVGQLQSTFRFLGLPAFTPPHLMTPHRRPSPVDGRDERRCQEQIDCHLPARCAGAGRRATDDRPDPLAELLLPGRGRDALGRVELSHLTAVTGILTHSTPDTVPQAPDDGRPFRPTACSLEMARGISQLPRVPRGSAVTADQLDRIPTVVVSPP